MNWYSRIPLLKIWSWNRMPMPDGEETVDKVVEKYTHSCVECDCVEFGCCPGEEEKVAAKTTGPMAFGIDDEGAWVSLGDVKAGTTFETKKKITGPQPVNF